MNDYASAAQFLKITSQLRRSRYLSDARIVLPDQSSYDVHKLLLAGGSDFFKSLFTFNQDAQANPRQDEKPDYYVSPLDRKSFHQVLNWIYSRDLILTEENVALLLKEAQYLDCREVIEQCVIYITDELRAENAIGVGRFAEQYHNSELLTKSSRFVRYAFVRVAEHEEFIHLDVDELESLLSDDGLNAQEQEVWNATMRWLMNNDSAFFPRLITKIRIGLFMHDFFKCIFLNDMDYFRPLDSATDSLLNDAKTYYRILECIADETSPLATPTFALPRLSQDVLLAFGGWSDGAACGEMESYDVRADRWTRIPFDDTLLRRAYLGTAVIGSKVYLIGGTNGETFIKGTTCFDVEQQKFTASASMHTGRCYLCVAVHNGYIYAIGGFDGRTRLKTMERFDPGTNQWSKMAPMGASRSDAGSATVCGDIYVVGGFDGNSRLASVEAYSTRSNRWRRVKTMSKGLAGVSCVSLNDELYVLGGYDGEKRQTSCAKYNPKLRKWTRIPNMTTARSNFSAVVIEGMIMVIGGYDGNGTTDLVECFDPASSRWFSSSDLRTPKSALSACVISGIHLSSSALSAFAYPDRDKLPEEKRFYERGLMQDNFYANDSEPLAYLN